MYIYDELPSSSNFYGFSLLVYSSHRSVSTFKQAGGWNKWPRRRRTKNAYSPPAIYTAAMLITSGQWNCSGRENAMVVAKESNSKKFWKEASTLENAPRLPSSTSWDTVLVRADSSRPKFFHQPLELLFARRDRIPISRADSARCRR